MQHSSLHDRIRKLLAIILAISITFSLTPSKAWAQPPNEGKSYSTSNGNRQKAVSPQPASRSAAQALPATWPDEINQLASNSGRQPQGMLIDSGIAQPDLRHEPNILVSPISISRVQSAYHAFDAVSGTLVITLTVTNNQPLATAPQIPVSGTITDTLAAISAVDFTNDPNTIHNVLVTDSLTANAGFLSALPVPDKSVSTTGNYAMAFNLGDIPPLSTVTATLALSVPTVITSFVDLDTGASAWGTLQGRIVSAQARPANLAPDTLNGEPIDDWLKWTVDADKFDEYMLAKTTALGQDPMRMFEYVRSLGYESYKGSLRGTRGTLWSEATIPISPGHEPLLLRSISRRAHGTIPDAQF